MQLVAVCLVALAQCVLSSDVVDLTDSNFAGKVADMDVALIEFFAPWCGHCKRLAPEYEKAATALKSNDPPVPLAKVDCTAETETCQKFGVSGYPTLKIFRGGEFSQEYQGPREADGIVKYMRSQVGPSSKEIKTQEDFDKFIDNFEHGIVGFFEDVSSKLAKAFKTIADKKREDFRFAHTNEKTILEKLGFKDDIVLYRPKRLSNKFEDDTAKFDGDATTSGITDFINNNFNGLAGHRTQGNQANFKQPLITAYYDVDYIKNPKGSNYWRNRVMKVAKKFADAEVSFAVSSADEFGNELQELGLSPGGDKPVVGAKDAQGRKFPMSAEFSMETFEAFLKDFLDGSLKPYLKSEPVPDNSENDVKVVVAENFDEVVNDETKDVLVEFYAPWCGHCKTLAPKYEQLAQQLAPETDLVIAKMDATANDVPAPYDVRGFPTIYFAPKGKKDSPKKYEAGRELDDFVQWLAKEATDELQGYSRNGSPKKAEL